MILYEIYISGKKQEEMLTNSNLHSCCEFQRRRCNMLKSQKEEADKPNLNSVYHRGQSYMKPGAGICPTQAQNNFKNRLLLVCFVQKKKCKNMLIIQNNCKIMPRLKLLPHPILYPGSAPAYLEPFNKILGPQRKT
jgi:hypothetical protein